MWLESTDLERRLAGFASVRIAVAIGPQGEESASGRIALDTLRSCLGDAGSEPLRFPHARYSLSHARGAAVAIGLLDTVPRGIGLDLEWTRPLPEGGERFYLSDRERQRLAGADPLRLWTLKEALFKADLGNASTRLHHYELRSADPSSGFGISRGGVLFRYTSLELDGGFLSVAMAV